MVRPPPGFLHRLWRDVTIPWSVTWSDPDMQMRCLALLLPVDPTDLDKLEFRPTQTKVTKPRPCKPGRPGVIPRRRRTLEIVGNGIKLVRSVCKKHKFNEVTGAH